MSQVKLVYLDYASTTPVDPEVVIAMEPYWREKFGNAGSVHKHGQIAVQALDDARESIKEYLGAGALREVIFTGSATEANNIAIQGIVSRFAFRDGKKVHIITSTIEHPSVLEPCRYMEAKGFADVTYISPDEEGIVEPEKIKEALQPHTVLVSIGYANNEIGTIQPISDIGRIVSEFRGFQSTPYLHTDAVQAIQFLDVDVDRLGVDCMTLSSHKIYGPKGVGVLYIRDGVEVEPLMYGGKQEYKIRPSTQNIPLIVGCATAIQLLHAQKNDGTNKRIQEAQEHLLRQLQKIAPHATINGSLGKRLPSIVNMNFSGENSELLLIGLSEKRICVSSGSACSARAQESSYVIREIRKGKEDVRARIRISLGKYTSKEDIDFFIDALSSLLHNRK